LSFGLIFFFVNLLIFYYLVVITVENNIGKTTKRVQR
jgi:hypothetical protein